HQVALRLAAHDVGVAARQLERGLVRLGAGVAEVDPVGERAVDDGRRRPDLLLVVVGVRGVQDAGGLLGDDAGERGVGVAERADRDARGHVEVAIAARVPQVHALAAGEHHRLLPVVAEHLLLGERDQILLAVAAWGGGRHGFASGVAGGGSETRVSSVPTPPRVKISRSSACSSRPSMMWTLRTPCSSAARAFSILGIMPPLTAPVAMSSRARSGVKEGISAPPPSTTPGTSVKRTSFSAPSATAIAAANGSALTLRVWPSSAQAIGATIGMNSGSRRSMTRRSTAVTSPTSPRSGVRSRRRARARLPSLPVSPTARPPSCWTRRTSSLL